MGEREDPAREGKKTRQGKERIRPNMGGEEDTVGEGMKTQYRRGKTQYWRGSRPSMVGGEDPVW